MYPMATLEQVDAFVDRALKYALATIGGDDLAGLEEATEEGVGEDDIAGTERPAGLVRAEEGAQGHGGPEQGLVEGRNVIGKSNNAATLGAPLLVPQEMEEALHSVHLE